MNKEQLFQEIIALEWEMFDNTQNIGGRASCQNDKRGFVAMRSCQLLAWNEETLASYLEDLQQAKADGRNLMVEKYARMMEPVYTGEYNEIADYLPPVTPDMEVYIVQIMDLQMRWSRETAEDYPLLSSFGRPIESRKDSVFNTSVETYLWSELTTYSMKTLKLYLEYITGLNLKNKNIHEMILQNTAHIYGFESAKDAEDNLRQRLKDENKLNYLRCYDTKPQQPKIIDI